MKVTELTEKLSLFLSEEPPLHLEDGGVITKGVCPELDELRDFFQNGKRWLTEYQEELKTHTGIPTLKIKYNRVFGYFIEVSTGQKDRVPDFFLRKQTLSNCERYTTEKLMEYQEKLLSGEQKLIQKETEIFEELLQDILHTAQELKEKAQEIYECDLNASFAYLALRNHYTKPEFHNSSEIHIEQGRHPLVETITENFIPNDYHRTSSSRFHILTGPNMGGKSTFLRQNALILYLAHIGSFVPAQKASLPLVDQIFTRVGANDNLSAGESTFMVEMLESAKILRNATEKSFIILDELGRGTSTFDGLSLAFAISEYIHNTLQCSCIFATHYHELTKLEEELTSAKNYSVAVLDSSQDIIFLHSIIEGGANKSYGIEVAKKAGIPSPILQRSKEVLHLLETKNYQEKKEIQQLNLFSLETPKEPSPSLLEEKIKNLSIEKITPLEALNILEECTHLL
jgi:DNA mismatch repair protein MutS